MATDLKKVLLVDDDPKVLSAIERLAAGYCKVVGFLDPEEALMWLKINPDAAVIISCVKLPGRGGIAFLEASEHLAPHASRILLTAEQSVGVLKTAVNQARIFMLLTKPCPPAELTKAIEQGIQRYVKYLHERGVLEKTLAGSVKMLIEMLSLFHAEAFQRTAVIRAQAVKIAERLQMKKTWELGMAVMLSPLGEALLPKDILTRYRAAKSLTEQQREILESAPRQTRDLLKNIPQLEKVGEALYLSGRGFDGSGFPEDGPVGEEIPLTSRLLKILTDLWYASPDSGVDPAAFEALAINHRQYDPHILEVTRSCLLGETLSDDESKVLLCHVRALQAGDILIDDVLTEGTHELVLSRGHKLTQTTIRRLDQYNHVAGVRQPIRVRRANERAAALESVSA